MVAKTDRSLTLDPAAAGAAVDADTLVRSALFLLMFLSIWISFHPFQSLAEPPKEVTEAGDRVNQIAFSFLFLILAAWTYFHEPRRLLSLLRPTMTIALLWCAVSVVLSWEPTLAARRLIFTLLVMSMAGMVLLLPKNLRHFSELMAAVVLVVLALCYLGLVLAPQLSMHQATDFLEPEHAGDWRGIFNHKNMAGMTMGLFFFVGLFVARVRSLLLGMAIVFLATLFLVFTHSKTAIAILPMTFALAALINRLLSCRVTIVLVVVLLVAFNLFTVGSVYFESIHRLVGNLLPDPTFTGRTELWEFAVAHLRDHPVTGYGFYAFWGTEQVVFAAGENQPWVNAASDAHNTYLNLALTIGLPGLLLSIVWLVGTPFYDFFRRPAGAPATPLQLLFLRIVIFGVFTSVFENSFYQQLDSIWFLYITAVFGLRYLSVTRLVA